MSLAGPENDRRLLEHYKLTSLYPEEWPEDKDDEEESDEGDEKAKAAKAKHMRRYTTLEKRPNKKAQKDEADPLGTSTSILNTLRKRGVPVEHDPELRNRFMLSSPSFSPSLYMSTVHPTAPTEVLLNGLDNISRSVEKKSPSLKALVEEHFERFLKAKYTLDDVYNEMRNHGTEPETSSLRQSRQRSRTHMRSGSSNFVFGDRVMTNEKRKNALAHESDYGTAGIKAPLTEATTKAEEVWGPALGGREREELLKTVLTSIEQNKKIFDVGAAVEECINRRDYDDLANQFAEMQRYAKDAKMLADRARDKQMNLTDAHIHQIVITARVWTDVQSRIELFKRETWRKLHSAPVGSRHAPTPDGRADEYMELISILLQLGVEDNPIWVWLLSRYDHLKSKINANFERLRVELEVQRRRLGSGKRPSGKALAAHLQVAWDKRQKDSTEELDTKLVNQFWDKENVAFSALLSTKGGLLGEIIEYWETTLAFIEGVRQRSLPIGLDGSSRRHHRLSSQNCSELQQGALELFALVRVQIHGFFVDEPIEDLSSILPSPQTPKSPISAQLLSPLRSGAKFSFDANDIPPMSQSSGAQWEKFAFWPPHSNSLSGVTYLSKINNLIGVSAAEMANVSVIKEDPKSVQQLRGLVGDVRERSITAVCAAWLVDSENCEHLEDWTRSSEKPDLTNMPARFNAFENALLTNLQKIMYVPETANSPGSNEVISHPSSRHIETIQKALRNSLYKSFSRMIEHAAAKPAHENVDAAGEESLTTPAMAEHTKGARGESIDASSPNVRKLLTLANFQSLRSDVVPALISSFESSFLQTITDDAKTARDVLSQMHARVFQSYARPIVEKVRALISTGVKSLATSTSRPSDARPYVYDVLLHLVLVHTEVSRTSPSLTGQVMSYSLEQSSAALLESFKHAARPRYSLAALMQATLDTEFLAQTLDNYTTSKASDIQSQIYLALDERTDNDARQQLQQGLPEMRAILKRLRERTRGEFGCFKRVRERKERRARDGEGGSG